MESNILCEKIRDFILKNSDEIAEKMYQDNTCLESVVCVDEQGKIFSWINDGNTVSDDIVIIKSRGIDYAHDCDDCAFNDYSVKEYDENTSCKDLQIQGMLSESFYLTEEEENMSIQDIKRQCIIDNVLEDTVWDNALYWAVEMIDVYGEEKLSPIFLD